MNKYIFVSNTIYILSVHNYESIKMVRFKYGLFYTSKASTYNTPQMEDRLIFIYLHYTVSAVIVSLGFSISRLLCISFNSIVFEEIGLPIKCINLVSIYIKYNLLTL